MIALLHEPGAPEVIEGVVCRDGSYYRADRVILAAGAMTSPRILQDHLAVSGPRRDAALGRAGRRQLQAPPQQRAGRLLAVHRTTTSCARPRSSSTTATRTRPCSAWAGWTARSWRPSCRARCRSSSPTRSARARSASSSRPRTARIPANRIITGGGDGGIPTADYSLERLPAAQAEHHAAAADFTRRLLHVGLAGVDRYLGLAGSAHAMGSMVTGSDPQASVVDPARQGPRHGRASTSATAACWRARAGSTRR